MAKGFLVAMLMKKGASLQGRIRYPGGGATPAKNQELHDAIDLVTTPTSPRSLLWKTLIRKYMGINNG